MLPIIHLKQMHLENDANLLLKTGSGSLTRDWAYCLHLQKGVIPLSSECCFEAIRKAYLSSAWAVSTNVSFISNLSYAWVTISWNIMDLNLPSEIMLRNNKAIWKVKKKNKSHNKVLFRLSWDFIAAGFHICLFVYSFLSRRTKTDSFFHWGSGVATQGIFGQNLPNIFWDSRALDWMAVKENGVRTGTLAPVRVTAW